MHILLKGREGTRDTGAAWHTGGGTIATICGFRPGKNRPGRILLRAL